jgi:HAD superfamily hydrolase (TIGR01509 family)
MAAIEAVLWDVDGTLAETERDGHRVAFNQAFAEKGLKWRWDEARYGELLRITGGRERILFDMPSHGDAPPTAAEREALARELHRRKNVVYGELVRASHLPLRPGVAELMNDCLHRSVRMGIVTTTSAVNVRALMQTHLGTHWREYFAVVVCGEDVRHKKPDPEAYQIALARLGLGPLQAVAIEDSPGGVASARGADIPVVVPLSAYFEIGRAHV